PAIGCCKKHHSSACRNVARRALTRSGATSSLGGLKALLRTQAMLIRISLIVAIIAGLGVGAINFFKVKQIIVETRAQRDDWHNKWTATDATLTKTKKDLAATTAALEQNKKDLAATKKDLATAQTSITDLKKQMATLQDNLANSDKQLTDAKIELEKYHAAFKTPQEALSVAKDMRALEDKMDAVEDEK